MTIRILTWVLLCGGASLLGAACGTSNDPSQDVPTDDAGLGDSSSPTLGGQDGGSATGCKPQTCGDLKISCGPAGDGCGGIIQCGSCTAPQTCGGGGTPSVCGGSQGCVAKGCAALGATCGPQGDGCGGVIQCGGCTAPEFCGGGGASTCGGGGVSDAGAFLLADGGTCVARTACKSGECGPVADGCGGLLTCAGCTGANTCGGGGTPSMCGQPACTKTTCAQLGADCGYAADGCGGLLDCGGPNACATGFCGGGGANKCGVGQGGTTCVNFCQQQQTCAAGQSTKIKGTVFAPNGVLPLPGAVIYVPNASMTAPYGVHPINDGVASTTCEQCSALATGSPLVSTTSAFDGTFTLDNMPSGANIPIVIQIGRWRRLVTIPNVPSCQATTLTAAQTRLPKTQGEGSSADNIPLFAISSGQVDGLECVFRKLGIKDSQFSNPSGNGRIRFYLDDDQPGATYDAQTPNASTLYGSSTELAKYDAVVFACPGGEFRKAAADQQRVIDYASKGGRVFSTHFNYVWLDNVSPWNSTVAWDVPNARNFQGATPGLVDTGTAKGLLFSKWLGVTPAVNALTQTSPPLVSIAEARNNADVPVASGAEQWITYNNDPEAPKTAVLHYAFNTPWGAAAQSQCGRVIFSDFHVSIGRTDGKTFPNECNTDPLTAQEKILAFMLFDLTACIQPTNPTPPSCTKLTCAQQSIGCGLAGDGCGGQLDCGACGAGQVCQGAPPACLTPACTPTTCAAQNANCGLIPNGCGGQLDCGSCATGQVCGGSGPNKCGSQSCAPTACPAAVKCGSIADGCGGLVNCGTCPAGQTCGGSGTPGVCGAPACTPRTCASVGGTCGFVADGCGGVVNCGTCAAPQSCGGGGIANACGGSAVPK